LWALVGLGNPGKDYSETRHNVGFMFVNRCANEWKVKLKYLDKRFRGAEAKKNENEILFAKPRVFMNMSGVAVKRIQNKYQVPLERLIVIHDDFDISLGEIRIKRGGSSGTHRGVKSVIEYLETQDFPRIRIGIGPVPEGVDPSDFVLSGFREPEKPLVRKSLDDAVAAFKMITTKSLDDAMNMYNRKRSEI